MGTYANRLRELADMLDKDSSMESFKILFSELLSICRSIALDNMRDKGVV